MLARENNFDALRFWAAMAVLWSHTVPLTQGGERNELMFRLSGGQTTTGTVAVFVFFTISGYLITRSYERAASPWLFVRARVLRIMPALLVVLLLSAFVIGPLSSTVPLRTYFSAPDPYRYVQLQGSLFFGWLDSLPGVWTDHPLTAINGAIWTLRFEAECYGLVFLLGISGLLRREITLALYAASLVALVIFPGAPGTPDAPPDPSSHLDLTTAFLAGALIHQWRVPLDRRLALACLGLAIAGCATGQMLWVQRTVLPYLVMYLAIAPSMFKLPHYARFGDVSYGLYLWAWPLTQMVVSASDAPRWYTVALIVTPLALVAGALSYNSVEKPALAFKQRQLRLPFAREHEGAAPAE